MPSKSIQSKREAAMVQWLLKAKFVSFAPKRKGEWPVELRHNGNVIKDMKTCRAYLREIA